MLDPWSMLHTNPTTKALPPDRLFILVADERSGKLLRRLADGALEEEWTVYSADTRVRSLGQSPDTRELTAPSVTPASTRVANETLVAEIAARLRETCERDDVRSIIVIAPYNFTKMMRAGFSSALWQRVQHTIPRDRCDLSDASLRKLVDETLEIYR